MIGRLFAADMKMILRNRQALGWALAFPILFATIFGLFNFDQLPEARLAVVAEDSIAAAPVISGLGRIDAIVLESGYRDERVARAALEDGDLDYVMVVPRTGPVRVVVNEAAADTNRIFLPIFQRVLDEVNIALANVERRYSIVSEAVAGQSVKYYDFVLPGLVGMAVMSYGIIGLASTLAQYRGQRILRRILATPLRPRTFLGAIVLAHLVLAIVQSALVLAFGVFVFGGTVRGNLAWIFLFVLVGNLTFLNIGFMVASRVQTVEAASGLGNAVTMPMMFFSGVFFPTSTLPWILPAVTAVLPLSPLVKAVREIAVHATPITELGPEMLQLVAWAIVTFLIASRMFRFERA